MGIILENSFWYGCGLAAAVVSLLLLRWFPPPRLHELFPSLQYSSLTVPWELVGWFMVAAYWGSNVAAILSPPGSKLLTAIRLAIINLTPLFLGGQTNKIADRLGLRLRAYRLAHLAFGTAATAEFLVHFSSKLAAPHTSSQRISGIIAAVLLIMICTPPLLGQVLTTTKVLRFLVRFLPFGRPLRRLLDRPVPGRMRSWGRHGHVLLSISFLGVLSWHLVTAKVPILSFTWVMVFVTGFLGLVSTWLFLQLRGSEVPRIEHVGRMTRLLVTARKDALLPGMYVYLRERGGSIRVPIAWWDPNAGSRNPDADYSVKTSALGTSRDNPISVAVSDMDFECLLDRELPSTVRVDGPYGGSDDMSSFQRVMLFAQGAGIASVLPYLVSYISRRHRDGEDCESNREKRPSWRQTQRVVLLWKLDDVSQDKLTAPYFQSLGSILGRTRSDVIIWLVYPRRLTEDEESERTKDPPTPPNDTHPYFNRGYYNFEKECRLSIGKETTKAPGSCIVAGRLPPFTSSFLY